MLKLEQGRGDERTPLAGEDLTECYRSDRATASEEADPKAGMAGMGVRLRPRPPKQTRFLLNAQQLQQQRQRRSWSESDLLKEIDSELQLAKGFLYANGVSRAPRVPTPFPTPSLLSNCLTPSRYVHICNYVKFIFSQNPLYTWANSTNCLKVGNKIRPFFWFQHIAYTT